MDFEQQLIVNDSGGLCSFWTLHRVIERYGKSNVTRLFADTLMEDEGLYEFLNESTRYHGVPLTVISDGRDPWQLFEDEDMMGNSRVSRCSKVLKQELMDKWRRANCYEMSTTIFVGLDWTEGHRLERMRAALPGWRIEAPMMWEPIWDKGRMMCELAKTGITLPRLYAMGFPHNNCGGFCVKAGQAHFAHLLRKKPGRFKYHELREQAFRDRIGKDVSIMKDRSGGITSTLTLRQLREKIEAGKTYDELEWGGCGCSVEYQPSTQTTEVGHDHTT